jgi:hypothetical protein
MAKEMSVKEFKLYMDANKVFGLLDPSEGAFLCRFPAFEEEGELIMGENGDILELEDSEIVQIDEDSSTVHIPLDGVPFPGGLQPFFMLSQTFQPRGT